MYAVVGCGQCEALWVVEGRPETTGCPRCGTRHRFERLRRFAEVADEDAARQARSVILAERSGHGEAFAEVGSFEELDDAVRDAVVSDEEYLTGAGLDAGAIEAAGENTSGRGGHGSELGVVRAAIRERSKPTREDVLDYAADHGVARERAGVLLERLVEAGDVTAAAGRYRLL